MDQFEARPITLTPELFKWPALFNPILMDRFGPAMPPTYHIHVASLALPADLQDDLQVSKDGTVRIKTHKPPVVTAEQGWEWLEDRHREAKATNRKVEQLLADHKLRVMYSGIRVRAIPSARYWMPPDRISRDAWILTLLSVEVLK